MARNWDLGEKVKSIISERIIHIGEVVSIDDDTDTMRIKVRIKGIDDHIDNSDDLPYAVPLFPKFLTLLPRKGETVKIILHSVNNPWKNREWLGPLTSQPHKLNFDPHIGTSRSGTDNQIQPLDASPSTITDLSGIFPKREHVSLQGRLNTDVILKPSEVLLRAGKFTTKNGFPSEDKENGIPLGSYEFNTNPGFISIRYMNGVEENGKTDSITNIVSNKINFISHNVGKLSNPVVELTRDLPNTDETKLMGELLKIAELQPVVLGKNLIHFLELVRTFIVNHSHEAPGHPVGTPNSSSTAVQTAEVSKLQEISGFPLEELLSKDIKVSGDIYK